MNKVQRRITAWIACFAILLAALAPSISHAVAAMKGISYESEICTSTGVKTSATVTGATSNSQPASQQSLHFEHCPFCSSQFHTPALPPAHMAVAIVPDGSPAHPRLFYQSSRPLFAWAAAQPRAPPAIA